MIFLNVLNSYAKLLHRQIITNHFLHFLALDRSDPEKSQILQLIAALLNWTDEQKEQAGLARSDLLNLEHEISPHATPSIAKLLEQEALLRGEEFPRDAVALYDFERQNKNELPLVEGQEVWISYRHGQGWLVAENPKTQQRGLVPESYVRILRDSKGGSGRLTKIVSPALKRSSRFRTLNSDLPRPSSPEAGTSILKISSTPTESARENGKPQELLWGIAHVKDQVHCPSSSASSKSDLRSMRDDRATLPSLREDLVMAPLNVEKAQERLLSSDDLSRTPSQSDPVTMQVQKSNDTDISRASSNRTNVSLTTATTCSSNMSRQNSFSSDNFFNSIEMVRDNAAASLSEDFDSGILTLDGEPCEFPKLQNTAPSPKSSQGFTLPILKRFMSRNSGHSQPSSTAQNSPTSTQPSLKRFMSVKSASTSSTNNGGRASTELQPNRPMLHTPSSSSSTIQNVRLSSSDPPSPLLPCSGSEEMENAQSNESSSSPLSSERKQRVQSQVIDARSLEPPDQCSRIEISKPKYQRPKHDRVFCTRCSDFPEGFRGEHELRRHQDRSHKPMVKKWIIVDPTDGQDHPKPVLPLSRCKACSTQKKKYGAYYNAAAHLRRAHFKPKSKAGNSKSKTLSDERVGGKGGGDWPPMNELKFWMKMVEEPYEPLSDVTSQDAVETDEESVTTDSWMQQTAYSGQRQQRAIPPADLEFSLDSIHMDFCPDVVDGVEYDDRYYDLLVGEEVVMVDHRLDR
jgi:hypothetical protein